MITSEQLQEWKEHHITKEIFKLLTETRQELINQLACGNTIGPDAEATHGLTNRTIGQIDGLNQLLNISFASENQLQSNIDSVGGY